MPKNRIAVVEDEGIVAMDISKCLSNLGYEVVFIADSGEKTIENLKQKPADLILMDVELKGLLNGMDTAKIIGESYDIPVVFLTAFEDEATLKKMDEISSYGYLVKPFEDEQLKSTVAKILSS
ncbi:MAG: response regulator [Ignavibacteria bacterium]|nr:response regulator [Ignavibacteria bacterium]MCC7158792.1 response regulator [Ignavibacteria bacterium]